MLLTELLPLVQQLSHEDKLQLLHFLSSELLFENNLPALNNSKYQSVAYLRNSVEAAAVLAQALAEEKATKHAQ